MRLRNYSHEKMRDCAVTAAQLFFCRTVLVLRQESVVRWAGIPGDERFKLHIICLHHSLNTTYIQKIKNSLLCVTYVHWRDITNKYIFSGFALECESSEHLLFFFQYFVMTAYTWLSSVCPYWLWYPWPDWIFRSSSAYENIMLYFFKKKKKMLPCFAWFVFLC